MTREEFMTELAGLFERFEEEGGNSAASTLGANVSIMDAVYSWDGQMFSLGMDASAVLHVGCDRDDGMKEALDRERAATADLEAEIQYKDCCLQAALEIVAAGAFDARVLRGVLTSGLSGRPPKRSL